MATRGNQAIQTAPVKAAALMEGLAGLSPVYRE